MTSLVFCDCGGTFLWVEGMRDHGEYGFSRVLEWWLECDGCGQECDGRGQEW